METKLNAGAIEMVCTSQATSAEFQPVVQIWDLKLVQTQQQQVNPVERYRVLISDGVHLQQGMLATQKNDLVKDGRIQKGSIIRMSQYVCNVVQTRMIILIVDLDVILEVCDLVGEPRLYAAASGPSPVAGSHDAPIQSYTDRPHLAGGSVQQLKPDYSHAGPYSSSSDSGRYTGTNPPSIYSKPESVAGVSGPASFNVMHGCTNVGGHNAKPEISRGASNMSSRPFQTSYQQPLPMYINRGPVAKNEAPAKVIPIAALNPYLGRWTIKARVTVKAGLKHYNNARGDGKVFSFDLLDSEGGEIRVTCFNAVADQFYNQIEAGKVYLISRGSLKPAKKEFNTVHNEYEIFLESTSSVQPCYEDDESIPKQQFQFRSISDVESMEEKSIVDVIGVVSSISSSSIIMRKNGEETKKRSLQLKDMSGRSVELTLWGSFCNEEGHTLQTICDSGNFPVLAVKSARVSDFNGKAVGTISNSQLFINPDFPEACAVKEWFNREGKNMPFTSLSRETSTMGRTETRKTVSQIKGENLGTSEKPDWITIAATISFVKNDNFCYTACPLLIGDRQCNKKVTNNGDGTWRCDRCDKTVDDCDYRYILQFQIQDHTGLTWVTAFQESGEEIMGIPAKKLYCLKHEEQDDEKVSEVIRKVLFAKFLFKLKVKEETFADEQRVKSTLVKAERINFVNESKHQLSMLDKLIKGYDSLSVPTAATNSSAYGSTGSRQVVTTPSINNVGREIGMQANQVGPYDNQYIGTRVTTNTSTGVYPSCSSCGRSDHNTTNCPSIMNASGQPFGRGYNNDRSTPGMGAGTASGECYKCHKSGHWARDCPGVGSGSSAYGSTSITPGRYGGGGY